MRNFKLRGLAIGALMSAVAAVPLPSTAEPQQVRTRADAIFTEPRGSGIAQLMYTAGDIIAFQLVRPKLPEGKIIDEANQRLINIMNSTESDLVKTQQIHEVETELAKARLAGLQSLQMSNKIPILIKYARIVGTTLVIVDVAQRAWVWSALNANPTWSPALTTLARVGDSLSTDNALRSR